MCGISLILGGSRLLERLGAMHAPIRHRGPDGEGFLAVDPRGVASRTDTLDELMFAQQPLVGAAFRRLRICDLSAAASQPMSSPDGRAWIVFNGEIYNFRELRRELESRGRVFKTHGDTEVALAAYETWGEHAFERLDGMWAIAIIDLARRRLVASRDRFGIKPLLWHRDGDSLLLASEIKQIVAATGRPTANRPLIEMYLRGGRYPTLEETFFDGIRSVPPATWTEWPLDESPKEPRFRDYWRLADFRANGQPPSYADAVDRTEAALRKAVDSHRVADVKVGALLSGGLDSSTLVSFAKDLPTYSLGYRDAAPRWCEMPYVDAMAKRDGIENHEISLDAQWLLGNMDRVLWHLEEPPLAMPAIAQYRVFELCAQHGCTVVLDGQGSDEITAGYVYHQRALLKDRLVHRRPGAFASELFAIARREERNAIKVFNDFFVAPRFRKKPQYDFIAPAPPRSNADEFACARADFGSDPSLLNRQLYFDVRWGNVKIILGYGDRNAMAHSVEARVPYFDRAFVELLFTLPDHYKIARGERKHVLRDVARRRAVPAQITERVDRLGFGTPDEEMIRGAMANDVDATILDDSFLGSKAVNADAVRRFVLDFRRGIAHDHRAIWRLYALARWARRFDVAF